MFHRPRKPITSVMCEGAFSQPWWNTVLGRPVVLDAAKAVLTAKVLRAVHEDTFAGSSARPVPIIELRVTRVASSLLAPAVGAGGALRNHQVAHLGGRIPHPDRNVSWGR
jgi:hypothetical protein